jgi:hypothetical protein
MKTKIIKLLGMAALSSLLAGYAHGQITVFSAVGVASL